MDVLDAIMIIVRDLFQLNSVPGDTANLLANAIKGFFQGIIAFGEMVQKMLLVLQDFATA